jgi:ribokinase
MDKILVIGSANTDMVITTQRFPNAGETVMGKDFFIFPGGKGANQAVAAARLDGNVSFICKTGNDVFGKQSIEGFVKENIDIRYSVVDEERASGVAVITVDQNGQNTIVVAGGANSKLHKEDIEKASAEYTDVAVVLMQLEIPLETVMYAASFYSSVGAKVILNPAPACELPLSIYNHIFLITPNETEAALLTGIDIVDEESAARAAEVLLSRGVQHVVITMGEKGAYFHDGRQSFVVAAMKVKAIDTTAAGDVFNGALAVAMAEQMPWKEAIQFAVKAASVSVTRMGAQTSAPFRKEI